MLRTRQAPNRCGSARDPPPSETGRRVRLACSCRITGRPRRAATGRTSWRHSRAVGIWLPRSSPCPAPIVDGSTPTWCVCHAIGSSVSSEGRARRLTSETRYSRDRSAASTRTGADAVHARTFPAKVIADLQDLERSRNFSQTGHGPVRKNLAGRGQERSLHPAGGAAIVTVALKRVKRTDRRTTDDCRPLR